MKIGNEIFIYYHNIHIIMIEADYNNWLEVKSKIENFDKISETNKKGIYEAEQELTGNEAVDLIEVYYLPANEESEEYFEYTFKWIGYDKELERVAKDLGCPVESAEEIVEMGGHEMMVEELSNFIDLGHLNDEEFDEISLKK